MKISSLYNKHPGETIYIVGTGPSLRVFPLDFLKDKITIGLNYVWKEIKTTYLLTIHPETIPNQIQLNKIITKIKQELTGTESFYFFQNNKDVKDFEYLHTTDDTLYVGRGIHTAALCLASKMGASTAVLVGVDMGTVSDQHHVSGQPVRFHGIAPVDAYREYYINAREIRKRLNINILTISPYLGLCNNDEEFKFLLKEKNLCPFSKPTDESQYQRDKVDFV